MIWDAVATCRVNRSLFAYLVHSVVHHFRKRSTSVPDRSVSSYSESALINPSFFSRTECSGFHRASTVRRRCSGDLGRWLVASVVNQLDYLIGYSVAANKDLHRRENHST